MLRLAAAAMLALAFSGCSGKDYGEFSGEAWNTDIRSHDLAIAVLLPDGQTRDFQVSLGANAVQELGVIGTEEGNYTVTVHVDQRAPVAATTTFSHRSGPAGFSVKVSTVTEIQFWDYK